MPSSTYELTTRFDRFDLLLVLISLIVATTIISLFSLFYISTFSFARDFLLIWTHQLPFLFFEIIILLLLELFSIYSASRIYYNSDSSILKSNMIRLVAIWCFLIVFMLVIAIQFVISKGEISELFLDDFYKGFYDFGSDAESTKFVNYVQNRFACCGSENSTDWDLNKPFPFIGSQIPDSCCKPEFPKCEKNETSQIFEHGCAPTIIAWSVSHSYIFLLLWFALILVSVCFCFLLKQISKQGHSEAIVDIKFNSSESENLMSANRKLLDYQNSFKKCNPRQVQIGFTMNDDPNSLSSNMNKLTRYSQIRYSKVKPSCSPVHQESDEHTELTCHQEHRDELSYVEKSSSVSSELSGRYAAAYKQTKPVTSCDKLDKIAPSATVEKIGKLTDTIETNTKHDQRNELHKTSSIKSIDRADRPIDRPKNKPQTRSIKNQSTNKPHKQTKDSGDCKSNPNYDPQFQESSHLSVTESSTKGHSPSSTESSEADEQTDHRRNLIHSKRATSSEKTMYNLDKLKNKFIDPYSTASSFWTDDFEDESDVSSRRAYLPNRLNGHQDRWSSSDSSFGNSPEGRHENGRSQKINDLEFVLRRQNLCSDCGKSLRTRLGRPRRRYLSGDQPRKPNEKFTDRLRLSFSKWIRRNRN